MWAENDRDHPMAVDDRAIRIAEEYRRRKTTSVLTIMFTDIAGSTELREQLGEVTYEQLREAHDKAIRDLVESGGGGSVVKSTGDGALAVFAEPSEAVRKALEIQIMLETDRYFSVRIGIDMGQVTAVSHAGIVADVFGRQVNRAARIQALTQPKHVLTSFHVYDCAVGWLAGTTLSWHNHGKVSIKGFSEVISIHEPYYPQRISPQVTQSATRVDTAPLYAPVIHSPQVKAVSWVPGVDPIENYVQAIGEATAELSQHISWLETVQSGHSGLPISDVLTVLWVDDFPQNNMRETEILTAAGYKVDLAISTLEAIQKLSSGRYSFVISDMGRGDNPIAGLELLDWMRNQQWRFMTLIYCSSRAVSLHKAEAIKKGALLCTAGMISLLDGILQVIRYRKWAAQGWPW